MAQLLAWCCCKDKRRAARAEAKLHAPSLHALCPPAPERQPPLCTPKALFEEASSQASIAAGACLAILHILFIIEFTSSPRNPDFRSHIKATLALPLPSSESQVLLVLDPISQQSRYHQQPAEMADPTGSSSNGNGNGSPAQPAASTSKLQYACRLDKSARDQQFRTSLKSFAHPS